jgi:membrane fusion protein (multidrug efflux system)
LRLGMPLAITTEAYPGRVFRGRVTAISPSADTTSRVFDVEVTVPNPGGQLKSGMIITLELPAPSASKPLLTVPVGAIVASQGRVDGRPPGQDYAVMVLEEQAGKQVARARNVTLGATVGNMVAIRQGVKAGERVVTNGAPLLNDGDAVRVVE